jgi:hypothetical protein
VDTDVKGTNVKEILVLVKEKMTKTVENTRDALGAVRCHTRSLSLSLSLSLTHTHTHALSRSLSLSLSRAHTPPLSLFLSHTHSLSEILVLVKEKMSKTVEKLSVLPGHTHSLSPSLHMLDKVLLQSMFWKASDLSGDAVNIVACGGTPRVFDSIK